MSLNVHSGKLYITVLLHSYVFECLVILESGWNKTCTRMQGNKRNPFRIYRKPLHVVKRKAGVGKQAE